MILRCTVATKTDRLSGVGLHSGLDSWLEVCPSEEPGRGIIFRSHSTGSEISACVANVVSTNRSTCLGCDGVRVDTVEHILSALYGCGISDAVVNFDGVELPIADGSSLPFVELLASVNLKPFDQEWEELTIDHEVVVYDNQGAVVVATPSENFWVTGVIDYSNFAALGTMAATYSGYGYADVIAPARTYGFHQELEALKSAGLGRGASYDNVVALQDDGSVDSRTPLRMADELVRHKILDIIGDLSLSQKRIKCGIVALRPSHNLNVRLTGMLLETGERTGIK